MIFHKHKAIFFHIGKTAGTSIEKMLMPNSEMDPYESNRGLMFGLDKEFNLFLHHATCKTTREIVDGNIFNTYFKFSVVRNPFTRMISVYYYLQKYHEEKYGDFRNFVLYLPELASKKGHLQGSHYIAQKHYTHIDGKQMVDYIGKFEDLGAVTAELNKRLGLQAVLPKVNIRKQEGRPKGSGGELYDEQTTSIIRAVYKEDFETYGYDEQLVDSL